VAGIVGTVAGQIVDLVVLAVLVLVVVHVRLAAIGRHVDPARLLHVAHPVDQVLRRIVQDFTRLVGLRAVERACLGILVSGLLGHFLRLRQVVVLFGIVRFGGQAGLCLLGLFGLLAVHRKDSFPPMNGPPPAAV